MTVPPPDVQRRTVDHASSQVLCVSKMEVFSTSPKMFTFLLLCVTLAAADEFPNFINFGRDGDAPSERFAANLMFNLVVPQDFGDVFGVDLNLDGATDFCVSTTSSSFANGVFVSRATRLRCALSPHTQRTINMSSPTAFVQFESETDPAFPDVGSPDINGDGLLDRVLFSSVDPPRNFFHYSTRNYFVLFGGRTFPTRGTFRLTSNASQFPDANVGFQIRTGLTTLESGLFHFDYDGDGVDDFLVRGAVNETNGASRLVLLRGSRNQSDFSPVEDCGPSTTHPILAPAWAPHTTQQWQSCDVNGDGKKDLIVPNSPNGYLVVFGGANLTLLESTANSNITLSTGFSINLPERFYYQQCLDLNGDAVMDLVFRGDNATSTGNPADDLVLGLFTLYGRLGRTRPSFSFDSRSSSDGFLILAPGGSFSFDDFDGDDVVDVRLRGANFESIVLLRNSTSVLPYIDMRANTTDSRVRVLRNVSLCSARIDFDGDGKRDLLLSFDYDLAFSGAVVVYNLRSLGVLWDSKPPFRKELALMFPHTKITTTFPEPMLGGFIRRLSCSNQKLLDLNQDGANDLVLHTTYFRTLVFGSARASQTALIEINTTSSALTPTSTWPATSIPLLTRLNDEDVNGDGFSDLRIDTIVILSSSGWQLPASVYVEPMTSTATSSSVPPSPTVDTQAGPSTSVVVVTANSSSQIMLAAAVALVGGFNLL